MDPGLSRLKEWVGRLVNVPPGGLVVDLGCGKGDDLLTLAERRPDARFVGLDRSPEWIEAALAANRFPNLDFITSDISKPLPFESGIVDSILSVNVLECLPDQSAFISECSRVLRPGGAIVMAHFDWDTQTFDGPDRDLIRRVVHAYNDWQQAWMEAADPWAGRRLRKIFAQSGEFEGEIHANTLTSVDFEPDSYGRRQAESFEALVRRGRISPEDYGSFIRYQRESAEAGNFFFSVTMFAFVGRRRGPIRFAHGA